MELQVLTRRAMTSNNATNDSIVSDFPLPVEIYKWCSTEIKVLKLNFTWTIKNISFWHQHTGETLRSSWFSADEDDKLKWCLKLCPKGDTEKWKDFLSLCLVPSCNPSDVGVFFEFSILNTRGEPVNTQDGQCVFEKETDGNYGFHRFIKRDDLLDKDKGFLHDDELSILCEVSYQGLTDTVSLRLPISKYKPSDKVFEVMFEDQRFKDVTLVAGNREFQAHKALLAAQSTVFGAMFEHEMKERKTNRVEILDIAPEVLHEMLQLIYTGRSDNLARVAAELIVAADKYALGSLKAMCEEALSLTFSTENVVELLVLADLHSAAKLKMKALEYISTHAKDVIKTSGWKDMTINYHHLMEEVLGHIVEKRCYYDLSTIGTYHVSTLKKPLKFNLRSI